VAAPIPEPAPVTRARPEVDDAAARGPQVVEAGLHHAQRADRAGLPDGVEVVLGEPADRAVPGGLGDVGQAGHRAEPGADLGDGGVDVRAAGDVGGDRYRLAAPLRDLGRHRLAFGPGAPDDRDLRALSGQRQRDPAADALPGAGDQGDGSLEDHAGPLGVRSAPPSPPAWVRVT